MSLSIREKDAVFSHILDKEPLFRRVMKVTVRHSSAKGQLFLKPEINQELWLTNLCPFMADDHAFI